MSVLSRFIFGLVNFAVRNDLSEPREQAGSGPHVNASAGEKKLAARRTGMQGEAFAYWYLRRNLT
jgi:hypothetical protein